MPARAGAKTRRTAVPEHRISLSFPTVALMLMAAAIAPIIVIASNVGASDGPSAGILVTAAQAPASAITDALPPRAVFQNAIPECLRSCRTTLTACQSDRFEALRIELASLDPGADPLVAYQTDTALLSCRTAYSSCASSCQAVTPPAVSCEASCANEVLGCVRSASNDNELAFCRQNNLSCLDRCGGGTGDLEQIPPALCNEQCGLGLDACLAGARYSLAAQDACRTAAAKCNETLCSDPMLTRLKLLIPKETIASCTDRCNAARNTCRAIAEGYAKGQASCDKTGKDCLTACRDAMPHYETVSSFPSAAPAEVGTGNASP